MFKMCVCRNFEDAASINDLMEKIVVKSNSGFSFIFNLGQRTFQQQYLDTPLQKVHEMCITGTLGIA